jgi:hypothetical protein
MVNALDDGDDDEGATGWRQHERRDKPVAHHLGREDRIVGELG